MGQLFEEHIDVPGVGGKQCGFHAVHGLHIGKFGNAQAGAQCQVIQRQVVSHDIVGSAHLALLLRGSLCGLLLLAGEHCGGDLCV